MQFLLKRHRSIISLVFVKENNKIVNMLILDNIFKYVIGIEIAESDDIAIKQNIRNIAKWKAKFKGGMP
ncbi:MAG: hypothetical protein LBF34_03950 [Puniceicoccales bacterium]|jgi:hypothetical protein|nr:hypothetical protein [Puniceicoccales bacterium]